MLGAINFKKMASQKKLYLVRHAKSSWNNPALPDFERTLNDRGNRDAPDMAKRLKLRGAQPDIFVSSTASRAKQTAEIFCLAYGKQKSDLILLDELYHASPAVFTTVIESFNGAIQEAMIFSHNNGITDFVNSLCANVYIANMPTCGIFAIALNTSSWHTFAQTQHEFLFFDYPRNL
jgi:phosphohistidine phosphatase